MNPSSASDVWRHFIGREGAFVDGVAGIASAHSISVLIRLLQIPPCPPILEVGAGIGTMTWVIGQRLHEFPDWRLDSIENEPFCLRQLAALWDKPPERLRVFPTSEALPAGEYGLVVVDGGGSQGNDLGFQRLDGRVATGGVVLVEGGRADQLRHLASVTRGRRMMAVRSQPQYRTIHTPDGQPIKNKGCTVLFFEPRGRAARLAWMMRAEHLLSRSKYRLINAWRRLAS